MSDGQVQSFHDTHKALFDQTISKHPYSIRVHRNNVTSILLSSYSSNEANDILNTNLSITFEGEKGTDLSGEVFSIFFRVVRESYFEGNVDCVPRVDPQTCKTSSCSEDTMFTTIGKIFSHNFILTKMFPIFISQVSLQSVLVEEAVTDKQLISSFLRYVDDFEKEAIESMLNGNPHCFRSVQPVSI